MTDEPRTYFEIEARASQRSDKPSAEVTGASAQPWGRDLPAPSYGVDPTGKEPPLGEDANALPNMAICWWQPGASEATAAADADGNRAVFTNQTETNADDLE